MNNTITEAIEKRNQKRGTDSSSNIRRRWTASMPVSAVVAGVSPMAVGVEKEAERERGAWRVLLLGEKEKEREESERDPVKMEGE